MVEESKCCSAVNDVMKQHFNKELVMTNVENENFENSTKCWICDNNYIDTNVPDKLELKGEMLSEYQLNIAYLNIPIANVEKLCDS